METLGNIFGAKKGEKGQNDYYCEKCAFICSKKYGWDRHLLTSKHLKETNGNTLETQKGKKGQNNCCEKCNKEFNNRSGLWKHKKKCQIIEKNTDPYKDANLDKDEIILMLIKQNAELIKEHTSIKQMVLDQQNLVLEIAKNGTNNNTNCNNATNSHNKAFNLNFFLNETCKDAMNITDFVESIKLQLTDLERVGELGYVEGISNIIVKNLKELDVTQRPVHCTDKKRETMYVKDENAWEKDEEKKKMHKLVKKVADKNMRLLPEYREKHPDYIKASSIISDKYNQMFLESLGGSGDNNYEKEEKIIQKVSREVFVDKSL
jgi:hypothetical protein